MDKTLFSTFKKVFNFICYLATWIISVYTALHQHVWLGFIMAIVLVGVHLKLCDSIKHEIKIIVIVTLMGVSVEAFLNYHHLLDFSNYNPWYPLSPPWLWGIWMMFATTLNSSLTFFQRHLLVAASCGAIDLPITYIIGERLGAIHLHPMLTAVTALSAIWFFLLPVAAFLARPKKIMSTP